MTERPDIIPPEIAEEYDLSAVLKEGPQGQTLLLRRRRDGQSAVLKRALGGETKDRDIFEAVRTMDGDGVPRILKLLEHRGAQYVMREYVEGKTLLELCGERGPFSAGEAADIGVKICGILERLHGLETPLIHRDIKAENVVLTPDGRCVLIDFGIARFYNKDDTRDTRIIGTSFAAAPEQFGYAQTDPRSDIYSVGVMLHELSTGECDLDKGSVPLRLRHVVKKCTRFDPSDRYQSAAELKRALLRVKNGRRRTVAVLAAVLSVALVLALGGFALKREPGPTDVYRFASPEIGREVARQLGKDVEEVTRRDLEGITSLKLIGEVSFENWDELLIHGKVVSLNDLTLSGMESGSVDTLKDIPNLPNLTELALCNQEISDLSPLSGCQLTRLALHGNEISDLSPLGGCARLRELFISCNPVEDLSPLAALPELMRLNVGATDITDLGILEELPALSYLELLDCPGIQSVEGIEEIKGLTALFVRPVTAGDLARIGTLTGLKGLGIWSPEPLENLSVIGNLTNLTFLFADVTFLESLEGIEGMRSLARLDVRSTYPLNAAPLAGLTALTDVNFDSMYSETAWSEVSGLTALRYATVSFPDLTAFRAALGGRDVEISVAPD